MALSLWNNGLKGRNYDFIDRHIGNQMRMSGTGVYVYMYQGTRDADGNPTTKVTDIQDVVWIENRDRIYDTNIIELRGVYQVQDVDFDLKQFGIFLSNDTLFVEFHLNSMMALLGRKLMPGDVLEFPHLRDDLQLDPDNTKAVNRFYVVQEGNRSASGYSATWHAHIWRVKLTPMTGAQEYSDILDAQALDPFGYDNGSTLRDIISMETAELGLNEQVVEMAEEYVKARYFETRQFYYVPGEPNPWIFTGDGVPPNGAVLLGSGTRFPQPAAKDDYYLRTDHQPMALYQFDGVGTWVMRELDYRHSRWTAANERLLSFLNNANKTTLDDGSQIDQKVALSQVLKYRPEADF